MKKESLGITVFGILFILHATIETAKMFQLVREMSASESWLFVIYGITYAAWFIAGVSILLRISWSRLLTLITAGVTILGELVPTLKGVLFHDIQFLIYLLQSHPESFGKELLRDVGLLQNTALLVGWYGLIMWYFLRPSVKAQFVKAATSDKRQVKAR